MTSHSIFVLLLLRIHFKKLILQFFSHFYFFTVLPELGVLTQAAPAALQNHFVIVSLECLFLQVRDGGYFTVSGSTNVGEKQTETGGAFGYPGGGSVQSGTSGQGTATGEKPLLNRGRRFTFQQHV